MFNYENICQEVILLVKYTGRYIRKNLNTRGDMNIETKSLHNYVTNIDKTAEEMLVKGLRKILPGSGFIAEEGTSNFRDEIYNWVIDPIDGTTNFIHGLPPFAISVALMEKNEVIIGVIYEIGLDECFYAWKGSSAFLNNKEIRVSNASKIKDSLIATGFPYTEFKHLDRFMETMHFFMMNSHGLRRLGSAATDIAYVACGRFEGFYEYGLNAWDVAAGILIVKQAGGKISDFRGGGDYLFGGEIIATNSAVFDEFVEVVGKIMLK
jgi:myo-inositol-1(or 4)-monophosphatase